MNLTDTHCHLDLEEFDLDRSIVLERAARAGVTHIIIPGINLSSSRAAIKLAGNHTMLSAAVGVHPTEASTWNELSSNDLVALASSASGTSDISNITKVVAIGEIGLDYYWNSAPPDVQKKVLLLQLELATEKGLPVILHMRETRDAPDDHCAGDLLLILEQWVKELRGNRYPLADHPGVLHSFSGSLETAQSALSFGFYIGVTGPITFQNARAHQATIAALPLERILLETDAPFLAPQPHRGKRNEPSYVRLIADKIALLHSCNIEEVARVTSHNAARLFAWKETA